MTMITPEERTKLRLFAEDMDVELAERCLDALEAAEARAEKAERARDVLAELVASGGFDCPGLDGECAMGANADESKCICDSLSMGSDARCWIAWVAQKVAEGK